MRQATGYGFAINGPFEVDVGRAQLAHESQENDRLQHAIGKNLGQILCSLFDASEDWPTFSHNLNLAGDITSYDLWFSLWTVVGLKHISHLAEQAGNEALFIKGMLWSDERGIAHLFSSRYACPTGLWGNYRTVTRLDRIQIEVRGCLDTENVFLKVANWPELLRHMRPGEGISYGTISQPLKRLMGPQSWRSVWLADLFEENQRIDAKTAAHIGTLINDNFLMALEETEKEGLENLLGTFQFIGQDGSYHRGDNLLIPNDSTYDYRDEGMRAAFAPEDRVLSRDYEGIALSFFKACRKILNAKASDMANWVLKAKNKNAKKAVVDYLLHGELDSELARELRSILSRTWLEELAIDPLLEEYNEQEQGQLLGILWLQRPNTEPVTKDMYRKPSIVLPRIYNWWIKNQKDQVAVYEKMIYPGDKPPELSELGLQKDIQCRRDWLLILMLGVVQKLGRTQPEAHRNFIDQRLKDGDLDIFADPISGPDAWMNVLKNFLDREGEFIQYYYWMTQFTGFFQLAKWLNHYAMSFLAADRLGKKFTLNHLLSPRTNPYFQGGGPDAPSIVRTLGIGAHFVVRELFRQGLITKPYVHPHCYMPVQRVRRLFERLGCQFNEWEKVTWSEQIHQILVEYLGESKATFEKTFDIPFLLIARNTGLQKELFGEELIFDEDDESFEDA